MKPAICETPFDVGRYSTPGEAEGRGRQTFNVGSSFLIPKKCRTQSNPVKAHQSKTKGHNPRTMEYAGDHRSIGRNSASDQARLSPAKSGTTPPRCVTGRSANILNSALFNFLLPKSPLPPHPGLRLHLQSRSLASQMDKQLGSDDGGDPRKYGCL